MNFTEAVKSGFSNYVTVSGRAQRSAFWYWVLFTLVGSLLLGFVDAIVVGPVMGGVGPLEGLFGLATLLPGICVGVRRLHDQDRTGWWLLLMLVPVIGFIVLLVFFILPGTTGENRFGPDPLPSESERFA